MIHIRLHEPVQTQNVFLLSIAAQLQVYLEYIRPHPMVAIHRDMVTCILDALPRSTSHITQPRSAALSYS